MNQPLTGYQLEPAHYYSEQWYEQEQAELFSRHWTFAGFEHELQKTGDFIVADAGHHPMIITRGGDGQLNALHNVCRHRGIKMKSACGHARSILCPYHAWRYALDGSLEHIPQHKTQFPQVNLEDWSLHKGSVAVWDGMVFVHAQPDASPLADWLGGLAPRLERFKAQRLVELASHTYEMAANWKFFIENHVDWLHLYYLHGSSLKDYNHDLGEITQHGPHWTSFEKPKSGREDRTSKRKELMRPIEGLAPQDTHLGAHLIFPNIALFTSPNTFTTVFARPTGPESCRVELRIQGVEGSDTEALNADEFTDVMLEDRRAAELLQRAVRSPTYTIGPMAMQWEQSIAHFHQHYRAAMGLTTE